MKNKTIEQYLLVLGKLSVMLELLDREQFDYISSGVLELDEIELAETIQWQCKKMITCISDQVRMVGERTPLTWPETMEKIIKQLNEEVENGERKSEADNNKGN